MHDVKLFWREFRTNYRTTGAIMPSGRWLSRALARFVAGPSEVPRRILEVGPGTGAVTRRLVAAMHTGDRLDLVERNSEFVRRLREQFETCPGPADRICVLHSRLEDLPRDKRYDIIVSGLPLNSFSVAEVETILNVFAELAYPNAVLSFFEYIGIRKLKGAVAGRAERARLRGVQQLLEQLLADKEIRREAVWWNIPPAWVHHVTLP